MSGIPIDQSSKRKKPFGQDGIWAEIRTKSIFTITDVVKATDIHRKTVSDYIKRLEAGGYVHKHAKFEDTKIFILVRDTGIHAPRLKKDGSSVTMGGGVKNMWRSMRILKIFTSRDLALHSTTETVIVEEGTAHKYCGMLLKAKYLRVLKKAVPGKHQATYRFVRHTGPKPPQIQNVKQVFDPNLGKVTYYPDARP